MELTLDTAEILVPDGLAVGPALARTTHLAIAAHPDDVEIMAVDGILACFQRLDRWFCGVVATDGGGSPRTGRYQELDDAALCAIRRQEQFEAARLGEYGALVLLGYPSAAVKDPADGRLVEDLARLLAATRPEVVYTHSPADSHDTHVALALRAIEAIRRLPAAGRPQQLYGCEVWRDLDWLVAADKLAFDLSARPDLQLALLSVFESQIGGGKRVDLATMGRRRAHATFFAAHDVDRAGGLGLAMDLTPLIEQPDRPVAAFVQGFIDRLAADVAGRIARLQR